MTLWNSVFGAKCDDAPQQQEKQEQSSDEETITEKVSEEVEVSKSSTPADATTNDRLADPRVNIHLIASGDGVIVSVVPAEKPPQSISASGHVPVDIVLVIDVSGSMGSEAPAPAEAGDTSGVREDFGLSVLDLTKHAARTIMETLNEEDRLAIVTFSNGATVLQPLISMNVANKESTARNIDSMKPLAATNMWQGIIRGLDQFQRNGDAESGRVPALMVLTDGRPNFGDPPKGYVTKLREMAPLPASIHTFGFGYQLDCWLLKAIAEVGSGNFSFIPDAGMIGTAFIHAVAHLQTTYATRCILEVKTPLSAKLRTTHGDVMNGTMTGDASAKITDTHHVLNLNLGNLQYGQSRDIYLECRSRMGNRWTFEQAFTGSRNADKNFDPKTQAVLSAKLEYSLVQSRARTVSADKPLLRSAAPAKQAAGGGEEQAQKMSVAAAAYHKSRAQVSEFLASFFKPDPHAGYVTSVSIRDIQTLRDRLAALSASLPARRYLAAQSVSSPSPYTKHLQSLLQDVDGQMTIALANKKYFITWAIPYFASLSHAHSRQLCNSFKDPGLQGYNDSAFFRRCRDELDNAFERIEPPTPSRSVTLPPTTTTTTTTTTTMTGDAGVSVASCSSLPPVYTPWVRGGSSIMAKYNNAEASCFAGSTLVRLPPDGKRAHRVLPISRLRAGMQVSTPLGPRAVRHVLRTPVRDAALCRVGGRGACSAAAAARTEGGAGAGGRGGVLVTAWHPIRITSSRPAGTSTGSQDDETFSTEWLFPADSVALGEGDVVRYTGAVYSVMLEPDADPRAHAIHVSNTGEDRRQSGAGGKVVIWGITLGHGITAAASSAPDVRAHAFFGDYAAVEKALLGLAAAERRRHVVAAAASAVHGLGADGKKRKKRTKKTQRARGVVSSAGVARDLDTGLVRGFRPL